MRTCKCGKANNPTRKFCVRCGASLLEPIREKTPAPKPVPEPEPVARTPVPTNGASVTTEDKWVRPSEVAKDRVRKSPPKVKSELEKAREAFARAEEVGIEEGPEGIVETRMLRASEVRELMEGAAQMAEEAAMQPQTPTDYSDSAAPQPVAPVAPSPQDLEEGILGSKSALVDKPKPTPIARQAPEPVSPFAQPESTPVAAPEPQPTAPAAKAPIPEPVAKAPAITPTPNVVPEVEVLEMKIKDPAYLEDVSISGTLTDLRHLHSELKQVKSDLDIVQGQLDAEVLNARNAAQVSKLKYEGLQEQTQLAKDEYSTAEKEYRMAEDRRKKEISTREKRMKDIMKRISKGESIIEKRIHTLDKEKQKAAQE
ncbi:MAG: hypothetical protein ACFFAY_01120 [Promethearchaeota archaeon]